MTDDSFRFNDDIFTACSFREPGGGLFRSLRRFKMFSYFWSEVSNEMLYFDIRFPFTAGLKSFCRQEGPLLFFIT